MAFDPNSRLDPGQVKDVRGARIGGRGLAIGGGGGLGLVLLAVYLLLGGNLSELGGSSVGPGVDSQPGNTTLQQECSTGSDANQKEDCRIVGYVNSVQKYWSDEFGRSGRKYQQAQTVLFSGQIATGCGTASTEVGPFYCPEDGHVYLDLGFFDELHTRFGATGGSLAEGYVVAHEYGHHIQDLTGNLSNASGQQGASGQSVRTELQADWTTGSRGSSRGESIPKRGPTARRLSARNGSRQATNQARWSAATRSTLRASRFGVLYLRAGLHQTPSRSRSPASLRGNAPARRRACG